MPVHYQWCAAGKHGHIVHIVHIAHIIAHNGSGRVTVGLEAQKGVSLAVGWIRVRWLAALVCGEIAPPGRYGHHSSGNERQAQHGAGTRHVD
jgi:hypothetical protein